MWKPLAMSAVTESWPARSDVRVNVEEIPTTGGSSPAAAGWSGGPTKASTRARVKSRRGDLMARRPFFADGRIGQVSIGRFLPGRSRSTTATSQANVPMPPRASLLKRGAGSIGSSPPGRRAPGAWDGALAGEINGVHFFWGKVN